MNNAELYEKFSTGFLLTKSSRWILTDYQPAAYSLNLTSVQLGVLFCLSHKDYSLFELCDLLFIDKTVASRSMKSLLEKNFVNKYENANDRRSIKYSLKEGIWENLEPKFKDIELKVDQKFKEILSKDEQKRLNSLLLKVLKAQVK